MDVQQQAAVKWIEDGVYLVRRRHHIPSGHVQVGPDTVQPVQSARDLGVYIDGEMRTHINHVLSSCYSALRCDEVTGQRHHTAHLPARNNLHIPHLPLTELSIDLANVLFGLDSLY